MASGLRLHCFLPPQHLPNNSPRTSQHKSLQPPPPHKPLKTITTTPQQPDTNTQCPTPDTKSSKTAGATVPTSRPPTASPCPPRTSRRETRSWRVCRKTRRRRRKLLLRLRLNARLRGAIRLQARDRNVKAGFVGI